MRRELLQFLLNEQTIRPDGSRDDDLRPAQNFAFTALKDELCVGGVYVTVILSLFVYFCRIFAVSLLAAVNACVCLPYECMSSLEASSCLFLLSVCVSQSHYLSPSTTNSPIHLSYQSQRTIPTTQSIPINDIQYQPMSSTGTLASS